jgi:hypothetical protein
VREVRPAGGSLEEVFSELTRGAALEADEGRETQEADADA